MYYYYFSYFTTSLTEKNIQTRGRGGSEKGGVGKTEKFVGVGVGVRVMVGVCGVGRVRGDDEEKKRKFFVAGRILRTTSKKAKRTEERVKEGRKALHVHTIKTPK
jgi:hypothetical protein